MAHNFKRKTKQNRSMKKLELTKKDITPLILLLISLPLLLAGVILKSLIVVGGGAGLMITWFLCIDHVIANHNMNLLKRIVFGGIIIFLPLLFAVYLKA